MNEWRQHHKIWRSAKTGWNSTTTMSERIDVAGAAVATTAAAGAASLSESSALAQKYVPHNLREVNSWAVTAPFFAETPPTNDELLSSIKLVPFPPECFCKPSAEVEKEEKEFHAYPFRSEIEDDAYYAVRHSAGKHSRLPSSVHVDNISDLHSYRFVWENILRNEREEVLQRYERYSQHAVPLDISVNKVVNINGEAGRQQQFLKATFSGYGIADANPPLMIGDTVLIRPLYRISLPLKPHEHQPPPPPHPPIFIEMPHGPLPFDAPKREKKLYKEQMKAHRDYLTRLAGYENQLLQHERFAQVAVIRQQERQQAQIRLLQSLHQKEEHPSKHEAIFSAMNRLQWSMPVHVAELRSKILFLYRASNPLAKDDDAMNTDKVVFSWANSVDSDILLLTCREAVKAHGIPPNLFNIRFVPSINHLQRFLTALDWLVAAFADAPAKAMNLLFPVSAPNVAIPTEEAYENNRVAHSFQLNDKQASFVSMVLGRTKHPSTQEVRGPMVLTGPAGTGKTRTVLSAIRAILNLNGKNSDHASKYRILVCTPSHTAADVVTRRLGQHMNRDELFRLFDMDRPVATVPVEVLAFCRQSEDQLANFTLPDAWSLLNFQVIVCICSDAHLLYKIGLTNQQLRQRRNCFRTYLEKSCENTGLEFELRGVDDTHFTHLFIDEAAQASEPETIVPLSVVVDPFGGTRTVEIALVGDPRQLSPSVYSTQAAETGLKKSWMERLLQRPVSCLGGGQAHMLGPDMVQMDDWLKYSFQQNGLEQLSVFLTVNYRGHPSFLMMPSVLFYGDRLQCFETATVEEINFWCEKLRWVENLSDPVTAEAVGCTGNGDSPEEVHCRKQFEWPLHFRGVEGKDTSVTIESGFASSSWSNSKEAEAVVDIVVTLAEQGVRTQAIGVMATFRGQVVLIRKLLRAKRLGGVNVGTVEDYQAVEYDVIVLSLTRSTQSFVEHDVKHRMGVFGQPKRSNVAMTRAEFMFIVVGSPSVMVKDSVWRQFVLFCYRNGLYYGDQIEDKSLFRWSPEKRIVRYQPDAKVSKPFAGKAGEKTDDQQTVAVGTLERLLRKTGQSPYFN